MRSTSILPNRPKTEKQENLKKTSQKYCVFKNKAYLCTAIEKITSLFSSVGQST